MPVVAYTPYESPLIDALMDGESIHQLMVDSRGDYAIFMLDPNGIVASWNKGAEQIKGYSRDEIVGRHFSVFYPAEDRARGKPERELLIAARDGRMEEEGKRVRNDGSEYWANVVISAVRDRADALVGFVKVTRDLTERRKEQARALADAQALQAVNAELESFTYSVSHDLRAPIRQIEGFAKILEEHLGETLDPQVEHYLHRIQEGSQQMGRLVDDLLHLAQLGRQHAKPRITPLDGLVDEVLTSLRAEILERGITCRVGALPSLECDPGLMKIVFTNLLSNAVKYTRRSEHPLIEVGQIVTDGIPVIYVRDNGVGFDMKYVDKLFGVFQRLHRTEDFEGAGVGLAIVSRIIRKHRGTIWAEARPDKGATFFFTIGTEPPRAVPASG
ncbi:MAG TPA: ATP-binding protein [Gemmatimonadaceae bacterium]|nr:ATP-binding protein [Gemmatimonadaceae bacterium]